MAAVSAEGSTVWVLMRRLNSSCSRSMALVVRADFHWLGGSRVKANSALAGLLQAVGHGAALQPPLAQERLAPRLDLLRGLGVDHVGVVGRDLLMQPLRRVGQEVAMLVNRAALWAGTAGQSAASAFSRPAAPSVIRNSGVPQPAGDEVIEHGPPGRLALPAHVRIASSTFCPSRRTPSTTSSEIEVALRSSRTRTTVPSRIRRTMSSPARSRRPQASQSDLHLAPGPADHVLADRAPEQRRQRPLHPARVGPGQVGARDQRLELARPPGVARQHGAAPLPRAAVLALAAAPAAPRSPPARKSRSAAACGARADARCVPPARS